MKEIFTKKLALASVVAAGLALSSEAASTAPATSFNAAVSYPSQAAGMYTFYLDGYHPELIKRNVYASGGGVAGDDYYYGVRFEVIMGIPAVAQQSFSLSTWEQEDDYSGSLKDVATAIAYSYNRDCAYGCYYNEDGETFNFSSANIEYWSHTKISDLEKPWTACAFDSKDVLYAIDSDGDMFTVDLSTGTLTPVGKTGVVSDWITGAIIDPATDVMYWSVKNDSESALYKVDLATAAATKLYDFTNEEQMGGMYFPRTYDPKAPGKAASSPSASFSGVSMTGRVQFRPPSKTVDGLSASGDITYHLYANGKEVATGQTTFGGGYVTVSDVTVDKADKYCFAVTFSNEAGEGPRAKTSKFVGPDVPKAPSTCNVTWADSQAKVSWYAVSGGVNGGTIDTSSRRYRVTRYPDGVVVSGDNQTTTSLVDELPVPDERTEYYYTVECICGDKVSAPTKSASFSLGTIVPPFKEEFAGAASLSGWTMLNPGTDTNKWSYNSSGYVYVRTTAKPADNWLVTPAVRLESGKSYTYSVDLRGYSTSYTEKFEVKSGTDITAESMTGTIIDPTEVNSGTFQTYSGTITPEADGIYYIGVHAMSENGGYIYLDNVVISEGVSQKAPAAVTDLSAEADESGAHNVTVSFILPQSDLAGEALGENITRIELIRDGESVKTVDVDLAPGAEFSIVDDVDVPAGSHNYNVICYNSYGKGGTSELAEVFVGFRAPRAVDSVDITETENNGEVIVKWSPVKYDMSGKTLSADDVTYTLLDKSGMIVADGMTETSVKIQAVDPEQHEFVQYLVKAVSEGGASELAKSELIPVGKPSAVPFRESFAGMKVKTPIGQSCISGSDSWQIVGIDTDWGVSPVDGDGGMAYLEGYANTVSALFTGKIDLADMECPALTFWTYNFMGSGQTNTNTIGIQIHNGTDWEDVSTVIVDQTGDGHQWNKVIVPLDNFAGTVIRVKFIASVLDKRFFYIDDICVTSVTDYNMAVKSLSAPKTVSPSEVFTISVDVENAGTERVLGYKVELYADDELVDTKSGNALEPEESATVKFDCQHSVFEMGGDVTYIARIVYGPDRIEGDNESEPVVVTVKSNSNPVATALSAERSGDADVALTWNAPDMSTAAPAAVTETFDTSSPWTTAVDGWTFVDGDKAIIGGIGQKKIPVSGPQSFFVMDGSYSSLGGTQFAAHSGTNFLCSMYSMIGENMVQSDDWAISPLLYGGPQTVTFYASSFLAVGDEIQYLESFEVLYSTTGTDVSDFKLIERFDNIPAGWYKYSAYLPEGAKYFAIRCVSYDKYMLFVDDVEFIPAGGQPASVDVKGYNVYRNGAKVNEEPVATTGYLDVNPGKSTHVYAVTAVYDNGESRPSETVEIDLANSGVGAIESGSVSIAARDGMIVVEGAAGQVVTIVSADGRVIASTVASGRLSVAVAPGVYVVKAGATTMKVAVK